ncbi:hypothetical protein [Flavobacterium aestivum]|uniref:hypothetical protein n=1 Tax=Flavobacterium aestivum TaxID=3003257 RepID=UPI0024821304|nr:hypothetical protein [Flavobacterium aestivum]
MKIKIILLSILINFSCYKQSEKVEKNIKDNVVNQNKTDNKISGTWQMCKSIDKGTEIAYNVCPIITFFSDGTGTIETADKKKSQFTYSQNDNKIDFTFASKIDLERFFSNITRFEYIIEKKKYIETLTLIHGDYQWILSRENR